MTNSFLVLETFLEVFRIYWLPIQAGGLIEALFQPFHNMIEELLSMLIDVMFSTPRIHPNPAVESVHRLTLVVAFVSSGLVVGAAGIYYITGIDLGVSYKQVRLILPRLIIGLAFATVALPLLQTGVEAADAFVQAFRPPTDIDLEQLAGLETSLVLVWFINAWLLLALVLLFVFRSVYLLFIAAVSPLLALAWSLPNTRPYADSFIGGWFVLLAVAPIDALVLRFSLAMLDAAGAFGVQTVSNWVLGVASFALMLWIPYQLYGISQSVAGRSTGMAGSIGGSVEQRRDSGSRERDEELQRQRWEQRRSDRDSDRDRDRWER